MKSYGMSILAILLLGLVLQLLPGPALAQHYGRCGNCGTVVDVDQIYYEEDSTTDGTVVGAIIGGLIGNQVGSGSGRTAATVAGAAIGGAVGNNVDRNNNSDGRTYDNVERQCRPVDGGYQQRIMGYDVEYRYRGEVYMSRLDYDPGDRLRVRVSVTPDG